MNHGMMASWCAIMNRGFTAETPETCTAETQRTQ